MKLECINMRKEYGAVLAIHKLNYSFTEGVYGLLGPNGAGKSTWMKILTSNLEQTEGEVLWDGRADAGRSHAGHYRRHQAAA